MILLNGDHSEWWFFSTRLKHMRKSNWIISVGRDEHKKSLKPPPSFYTDSSWCSRLPHCVPISGEGALGGVVFNDSAWNWSSIGGRRWGKAFLLHNLKNWTRDSSHGYCQWMAKHPATNHKHTYSYRKLISIIQVVSVWGMLGEGTNKQKSFYTKHSIWENLRKPHRQSYPRTK